MPDQGKRTGVAGPGHRSRCDSSCGPALQPATGTNDALRPAGSFLSAARRVNVSSRMRSGRTPDSTRCATRCASVLVLPVPAPAMISSGPEPNWALPAAADSEIERVHRGHERNYTATLPFLRLFSLPLSPFFFATEPNASENAKRCDSQADLPYTLTANV